MNKLLNELNYMPMLIALSFNTASNTQQLRGQSKSISSFMQISLNHEQLNLNEG